MKANDILSIAIETTCRAGGVALGVGDTLGETIAFDAQRRHATQLVARLADLLARAGARPSDVGHLYVSAGPGGFTGTRVGITVARTLAQVNPHIRCVAVPTPEVVLAGASGAWDNLAVVLDAGKGLLHATLYAHGPAGPVQAGPSRVTTAAGFLADSPRPLTLMGEGLAFHALAGEGVAAMFPPTTPATCPRPPTSGPSGGGWPRPVSSPTITCSCPTTPAPPRPCASGKNATRRSRTRQGNLSGGDTKQ